MVFFGCFFDTVLRLVSALFLYKVVSVQPFFASCRWLLLLPDGFWLRCSFKLPYNSVDSVRGRGS
jgi:hypothetical protein